ncbi:huntingtin-like [Asbolus verrucosus]|uniref:Huntingtin-like n=1 Tax=Asbolus verrucosus TaxID=1661398 RepID=A0A482VZU6_ASBVE|nr:huntingtin-like [Asbolus verrucosus]
MATQEKLLKSLEILKNLSAPNQTFDPLNSTSVCFRKKDKIQHCHIVTEAISNSTIKIAPNFHTYLSITIEVLLQLCDDQESDVRMTAEECLNRIIRALNDGNIGKVQIELHKGIKRNGPARSLRAALWRFAQLAYLIRPHKGKPYVVNLFPTLIKMSERTEEQIHETLANSLTAIMKVLGSFSSDNEIKGLLKDLLIPVSDSQNNCLILGVMMCFKSTLPYVMNNQRRESDAFDAQKRGDSASISLDKLLQIYELCLYYFSNKDHNIINSALETANILLQNCPPELKLALKSENGVDKSRISLPTSSSMSAFRSPSQLSVATSAATEDLFLESELTDTIRTDIEKWIDESKLSVMNMTCAKTYDVEKSASAVSKGSLADVSLHLDSFDYKVEYVPGVKSQSIGDNLERLTLSDDSSDKSFSCVEDDKNDTSHIQEISIGNFLDKDVPLAYCARLIAKSFLLSGHVGTCISDKIVRVSVKSLALSCLSSIIKIHPKIFMLYLDKNCLGVKSPTKNISHQQMADLILYGNHSDPQLRGIFRTLLANFITSVLNEGDYSQWIINNKIANDCDRYRLDNLINILIKENTVTTNALYYTNLHLSNLRGSEERVDLNKKHLVDNMPFPFSEILRKSCDKIEFSLSKIVTKLYNFLLTTTSKHFIFGCIESLSLLSNTYPTTVYTNGWSCCRISNFSEKTNDNCDVTLDLFNICIYLMSHSVISYDLACHLNLLSLSSNLYAGYALCLLKPIPDTEPSNKPWDIFCNSKFSKLTEHYLTHLVKLLNIFHYVLDEISPSQSQSKPVLSNLSTSSPIKRRKSDLDKSVLSPSKSLEKEEKDKKENKPNAMGSFAHLPHYMKIYEVLRSAYTNYKITLESEACEKFLALLRQTLNTFSVLMEVGTLIEFQGIAEEILGYFRFTFTLEASATVECVQQLLKCLFGNNLTTNIAEIKQEQIKRSSDKGESFGFYSNVYEKPYDDVSACFNSFKNINKVDCDGDSTIMGYLHRKDMTKPQLPPRSSDKILANYIRIFEPMVIKSLKHYTITSDVKLQCKVLQLLNQLIQLRVNYCLLDSEQIFIGFVLKQFEYIEEGQIPFANNLIKKIFQFLVQLSYSKQHSKSIMTIPKIIQLCDGLMASGQSPLTHCIPALEPIVENIFLTRNKSSTIDAKELETTRDVVLSMLLRLCEYHQVIDLIVLILDDSKYCCNNPEKWLRWSTQVVNVILPMLKQNKIRLDSAEAFVSFRRLLFVLDPSVFKQVDGIILTLFQEPLSSHCKIAVYAISNVSIVQLEEISTNFLKIKTDYPVLTFLWCYVLTLLNYNERDFWSGVMTLDAISPSINEKVVATGSVILFCDYMSQDVFKSDQMAWFLGNHIAQIVSLSDEDPVSEFVSSIHRNSVASKLFVDSLQKNGISKDLLLPELLISRELAISRLVANLASRKIELLLTMSMKEVAVQLPKEELLEMIEKLVVLNLVKKHEGLSSLLNRLCTQYYEVNPLELDQKRCVNPDYIKQLQINKSWYLSQIRGKCNSKETAQLLSCLNYEELKIFMENEDFNRAVFKECFRLGWCAIKKNQLEEEPPLIKASVECLLKEVADICERIPQPHQVYKAHGRNPTSLEQEFSDKLTKSFDDSFLNLLSEVIPSLSSYIEFLPHLPKMKLSDSSLEVLFKFGVVCLESINYLIDFDKDFNMNYVDSAITCSKLIFREKNVCSMLNLKTHISWLCSAVNSLYKLVEYLLINNEPLPVIPKYGLESTSENAETACVGETCHQLYILVMWLYKIEDSALMIPKFIFKPIKNIVVSLSRLSVVNSYILIPAQVWKSGWTPELSGDFHTQVPPLPIEFLQEIDILEEFIYRITLLGWTSRQQFEETWMCLLSVLCNNSEEKDSAIVQEVVHASTLAVKAITALLVQTLYFPVAGDRNMSKLIHVSRYSAMLDDNASVGKLRQIQDTIEEKHAESNYLPTIVNVFKHPNFEKRFKHYSYSQMSVKYLLVSTKTADVDDNCETTKIWRHKENLLESSGLDINSCLQFLLDYYTQLLKQQLTTPLRFLHEIVRSTVIISDLFTDKSQFSWMLEVFFELSKVHTVEDELLHQYLIVGISKATAVLTPDLETYESIKKILVQYLKSSFLPSRMSCLHGLLYILEGCKLSNISIGGISEEMQVILPCAVEYVQCNLNSNNGILKSSQEHTVLVWTLAFFLIENVDEPHLESSFVTNSLNVAFTMLLQQKLTITLQTVLMKAIERLVIFKKSITRSMGKQIMNLALMKIKNENPYISILGMQLLLTYMYIDYSEQPEAMNSQTNPDHLVQTIEKVSAIFEHIKRGYVFEIEILCFVLPDILNDFFSPSDILTKVIGEFLSPQQPHPKLLSGVVFQVFERAIEEKQLPLLQDWVVFSLSNFTQSLSIGMATWCLTCFFISASSNEWLRLFFPYVQTRVGRYEYEDRKVLCIAGSDFYKNLTNKKQKETFIENFNKIKDQPDTLFQDLLSSL